jgi:hypothetical protein
MERNTNNVSKLINFPYTECKMHTSERTAK